MMLENQFEHDSKLMIELIEAVNGARLIRNPEFAKEYGEVDNPVVCSTGD